MERAPNFLSGVNSSSRVTLDSAAQGSLADQPFPEAWKIIERVTRTAFDWQEIEVEKVIPAPNIAATSGVRVDTVVIIT